MVLYLELVITGLLSVLLAFLLGMLFYDGGGSSNAGDDRANAPVQSDQNPAPNPSPDPKEKYDETEPDDARSEGVDKVYSFLFEGDARSSDIEIREEEEKEEDAVESRDEEVEGSKRVGDDDEKGDEATSEDEEWEGIERSEKEEEFREAAAFVDGMGGELALLGFGDDEKMQLFGLRKVAMEGPCYESQPMALNLSARAKWYA